MIGLRKLSRRAAGARPDESVTAQRPVAGARTAEGAGADTPRDAHGRVDFGALLARAKQADLDRSAATIGGRSLPLRLFYSPEDRRAVVAVLDTDGCPTNVFEALTFTAALTRLGMVIDSEEGTGAPTT